MGNQNRTIVGTNKNQLPSTTNININKNNSSNLMHTYSSNLKNLNFILQFELISNNGEIFQLGHMKYCLADSSGNKQLISDMDIFRLGAKEKIGYLECQIDSPDRLGLSYFIPANCIVDQFVSNPKNPTTLAPPTNTTIIPPCKTLNLKNKQTPYILHQNYPITL
jgi:hypothetical protein